MITSETRPGSIPARPSAAVVATAPLKLPTGVRAALTMTTSSDMDISWGLRVLVGRAPDWQASFSPHPVNVVEACQPAGAEISPRRIQNDVVGVSPSTVYALELTVPHKTVAEAH